MYMTWAHNLKRAIKNFHGLESSLAWFFRRLAIPIAKCPWLFVIVPIVLTIGLGYGVTRMPLETDLVKLYTPRGAPFEYESKVYNQFWTKQPAMPQNGLVAVSDQEVVRKEREEPTQQTNDSEAIVLASTTYWTQILYHLPDEGYILEDRYMELIERADDFIRHNLTFGHAGKQWTYVSMCTVLQCDEFTANIIKLLFQIFKSNSTLRNNPQIRLTYPVLRVFDKYLHVHYLFNGLVTNGSEVVIQQLRIVKWPYSITVNGSEATKGGTELVLAFQNAVKGYVAQVDAEGQLRCIFLTPNAVGEAMLEVTNEAMPKIGLSFFFVFAFAAFSCFSLDGVSGKFWEGVAGMVAAGMAIVSSVGLLCYLNVTLGMMNVVLPFLIFGVGMDGAFVLLGSWHTTDRTLSPQKRLELTLEESGCSVFITSITNVISFALGSISTSLATSSFCGYTSLAIFFAFSYQITFFTAIMYIGGRREANKKNYLLCCIPASACNCAQMIKKTSQKPIKPYAKASVKAYDAWVSCSSVVSMYCRAIQMWPLSVFIVLFTAMLLSASLYGCAIIQPMLSTSKLIDRSSPVQRFVYLQDKYFWAEGIIVSIIISKPPDFNNLTDLNDMFTMVGEFESTKYSMGEKSTLFWVRNYMEFLVDNEVNDFYDLFDSWIELESNSDFAGMIYRGKTELNEPPIWRFYISTGYFKLEQWNDKIEYVTELRAIAKKYSQFGVSIYEGYNMFIDQIIEIPDNTAQSVGIELAVMALILVLLTPNLCVLYTVFSMVGTIIGVIGFLAHFGADLDPISASTISISVGFSVDFVTHITYRFHTTTGPSRAVRVRETVQAMLWPTMQGGLAIVLGVVMLASMPVYSMNVVFLTLALVVAFGLWYSLVLMPVIFTHVPFL